MSVQCFVEFVLKGNDDSMPKNIHPIRWKAMVNWCKTRFQLQEPLVYEEC